MSLRFRLFLILGALVAALVLAHGWLARSLAGELSAELDVVALDVGASVAQALSATPDEAAPDPQSRVKIIHLAERLSGQPLVIHETGEQTDGGEASDEQGGKIKERVVIRHIRRPDPGDGAGKGGSVAAPGLTYFFSQESDGEQAAGPAGEQQLVIRIDGGAPGALQLRGPGLAAEVPIPRLGLQEKLADFQRRILFGSLLLLLAGLAAAAYLAHRVASPLLRLSQAAVAVGDGGFGVAVDERAGAAEVREALHSFNRMSARLRELSEQNRRLAQDRHLGEIGEIARGLAHSLRNPLHALGLSVDELADRAGGEDGQSTGRVPTEERALAAAARRQIGRLDRGIRSFLVFASQSDVEPQQVDLGILAEDVALEALQQQKGIRIEVEKMPGDDLGLEAVEQELRAMVQTLVVNAVEASPPDGKVELRAGRDGDRCWVEVSDRGGGLAPEVRERLFTPHLTTKASGSGMGLFLAQRLAAGRYRGSLELHGRDGGGTRARLELGDRAVAGAGP
jgi:signal transduction histidine kinase